jgi:hypothetical protein
LKSGSFTDVQIKSLFTTLTSDNSTFVEEPLAVAGNQNPPLSEDMQTIFGESIGAFQQTHGSEYTSVYVNNNKDKIENAVNSVFSQKSSPAANETPSMVELQKQFAKDRIAKYERMLNSSGDKSTIMQELNNMVNNLPDSIRDWANANIIQSQNLAVNQQNYIQIYIDFWTKVLAELNGEATRPSAPSTPAAAAATGTIQLQPHTDVAPVAPKPDCADLQNQLTEANAQITALQAQHNSELETLKQKDAEIKRLTAALAQAQSAVQSTTTPPVNQTEEIEALKTANQKLTQDLAGKTKNIDDLTKQLKACQDKPAPECPEPTETTEIKSPSGDNVALSEGMVYIYQETRALKTGGHSKRLVKLEGDKLSIQNEDKTWSDFNQKLYDDMYTGGEEKLDNAPVKVNPDNIIETLQRIAPKPEKPP